MVALRAYGWDEAWASEFAALDLPGAVPARVASQHRDRWSILWEGGPAAARLTGSDQVGPRPVTGDWIVGLPGPWASDPWTILAVLPRRSAVRRGSAGVSNSEQVLAANVDRLWIVQGLDRPVNLRSLERYLALAWESGASPEIVLTKSDLAGDAVEAAESVEAIAFGVPVWMVSVESGAALATLRQSLVFGRGSRR